MLMRIGWYLLSVHFLELSHYYISLTLEHLKFLEHFGIRERKEIKHEEGGKKQGGAGIK